ncbi:MAG: C40 family peptidase [Piscinibacter sp.]|nr:C40 family peptidase [Piscinibacter sp.]
MPRARPSSPRPPRLCLLLAACSVAAGTAQAAPSEAPDPLAQLITERGLSEPAPAAPEPGLARRVGDKASEMVVAAMAFLGVRYRSGGGSADTGFDCSGFTRHVFQSSLGLLLPRRVDEQASAPGLVRVQREDLRPGDLVFFNTLRRTFSHVGIYIGDGRFIHSPRSGAAVRIEDMRARYWTQRFTGARRAERLADATAATAPAATPPVTAPTATDAETFRVLY